MDSFSKLIQTSLDSYFNILSNIGQVNNSDTDRILVLSFIEEMMDMCRYGYVTEEDYNHMIKAIYCICNNSCIIKFPEFTVIDGLVHDGSGRLIPRVTEDTNLRSTEDEMPRIKA